MHFATYLHIWVNIFSLSPGFYYLSRRLIVHCVLSSVKDAQNILRQLGTNGEGREESVQDCM